MRGFHLRHSTGASSGVTGGADQHTHTVVYHHTHASYAVSNSAWLHLVHGGGPSDANIAANNHTHGTGADTWTGNLSAYNAPPTVTLAFAVRD